MSVACARRTFVIIGGWHDCGKATLSKIIDVLSVVKASFASSGMSSLIELLSSPFVASCDNVFDFWCSISARRTISILSAHCGTRRRASRSVEYDRLSILLVHHDPYGW